MTALVALGFVPVLIGLIGAAMLLQIRDLPSLAENGPAATVAATSNRRTHDH